MKTALRILPVFFLALGMFYYPQEVLSSALNGLTLWWKFVLPALLPFFIISDLLMTGGFVHFLGVLLEPLMRPLFRLPGKASFVIAMSYTSGIPIGAVLTSKMRQQGELTREEGERLLAFTTNPSPGFMFGAVASGMLGNPSLGIILAASVYLANLTVGLLFRFYRVESKYGKSHFASASVKRAWQEMAKAQATDNRPFGQLLGDSIRQSVTTVLMVGGFMTFFSVIVKMLTIWQISAAFALLVKPFHLNFLSFNSIEAIINGLLETTLGCLSAATAYETFNQKISVIVFFLGWGGLSVFAQVASFTSSTDLRFSAFVIGRTLHGLFAVIISKLLLTFTGIPVGTIYLPVHTENYLLNTWRLSSISFLFVCLVFLILSALVLFFQKRARY